MANCDLPDAALRHISCLTGLENLDISNNGQISDAGLLKLIGNLTGLKNLDISNRYGWDKANAGLQHISLVVNLRGVMPASGTLKIEWGLGIVKQRTVLLTVIIY